MPSTVFSKNGVKFKVMLLVFNVIIIIVMALACCFYIFDLNKRRERNTKASFAAMVNSMRKVARSNIEAAQRSCNDWACYINANEFTLDEALKYLSESNSLSGSAAHILDYDTLQGVPASKGRSAAMTIDYSKIEIDIEEVKQEIKNSQTLNITPAFTNPEDGISYVGFCADIVLSENGSGRHYILMRLMPLSFFKDKWLFPEQYEQAELSIITKDGDFVISSEAMQNDNFWEHIRKEYSLSLSEYNKFRSDLLASINTYELTNESIGTGYFVCVPFVDSSDRLYIGYLPKSSIINEGADFTLVLIVTIGILILVLIDGGYILYVNKKLKISVKETARANMAKTQFLSSMSHDIRTPMNAIVGITNLASKHTDDPEYIGVSLKKISRASSHLLTLINDVLDISKIESGKLTFSPIRFSLADSFTNMINIVRPQVNEKGLGFEVYACNIEHEFIFADELRMNQVFINLLTNAVKYTPEGGKISVSLTEQAVENEPERVRLIFVVKDNGIGMSEDFQKVMYENFSRATDTRIDKVQGTGLGLAITKQMVDLMDGTISCESCPGKGTTFTVELEVPLSSEKPEELKLPPIDVLLADDDEIFRQEAEALITGLGANIETAPDGETAVKMTSERHKEGKNYRLIIVDWKMPGIDGIETIRRIRESEIGDVPIIVVSAYDCSEIEHEAIASGASGFLTKPFFPSIAHSEIMRILERGMDSKSDSGENDFELKGIHLLIAEDNDINWEIIEEALGDYGVTSERAENGKLCVEMLEASESRFDAVLMDIQMPVMNGYQAAKQIRSLTDETKKNIPIIAMTADAFAEAVKACLDVGMNGHVAKPIEIEKIFDELRKAGVRRK